MDDLHKSHNEKIDLRAIDQCSIPTLKRKENPSTNFSTQHDENSIK